MTTTTGSTIAYAYQYRSRNRRTELLRTSGEQPGLVKAPAVQHQSADRVLGNDVVRVGLGDLVERRLGLLLAGEHVGVGDLQRVEQLTALGDPGPLVRDLGDRLARGEGGVGLDVGVLVDRR